MGRAIVIKNTPQKCFCRSKGTESGSPWGLKTRWIEKLQKAAIGEYKSSFGRIRLILVGVNNYKDWEILAFQKGCNLAWRVHGVLVKRISERHENAGKGARQNRREHFMEYPGTPEGENFERRAGALGERRKEE